MILPGLGGIAGMFSGASGPPLLTTLTGLGLTTNLKLCLDAGDALSVTSTSATKWLDRSGGGYDFFRGTDATSQASDPTFNGVVGGLSLLDYWSFDGGDIFRYDTTNETWMQNLHKAGAKFSFAAWIWMPSTSAFGLFGTTGSDTSGTGVALYCSSHLNLRVNNAGSPVLSKTTVAAPVTSAWMFVGASVDATAPSEVLCINGTTETFASAYSSPSASSATFTMEAASIGFAAPSFVSPNTSRMAALAIWEGVALSSANLNALFAATRAKFGA